MAQLDAGHIAKMNVEHQAVDRAGIAFEKSLCRIVPLGFVTVRVQQPFDVIFRGMMDADYPKYGVKFARRNTPAVKSKSSILSVMISSPDWTSSPIRRISPSHP